MTDSHHPTFEQVLPYLLSARQRGQLVPFIGSGLSLPTCTGWRAFVEALAARANVSVPWATPTREPTPNELYRVADAIVSSLSFASPRERRATYLDALRPSPLPGPVEIPASTRALASGYWPLTLTTNYDDLFLAASRDQVRVFGRSLSDCHEVLGSLDTNQGCILWALQGFVGGPALDLENTVSAVSRRDALLSEMVVGHRQYQEAINAVPHFRRAFAEVFRRRVLLFLGSGILEDYLLNLFSEIIHQHGVAPQMHVALVPKSRQGHFDAEFLERRLGILPIFYEDKGGDHSVLTKQIDAVVGRLSPRPSSAPRTWRSSAVSFNCGPVRVDLCYGRLSEELARESDTCIAVSLGRNPGNVPLLGVQAEVMRAVDRDRWAPLDGDDSYTFRYDRTPVFGIAVRRKGQSSANSSDLRDLSILADAVECTLRLVSDEASTLHVSGLATGQGRKWHPVFSTFETLRGIGRWFRLSASSRLRRIVLHCSQPEWAPIVAGKVPVQELLSSEVFPYGIELVDEAGRRENYKVVLSGSITVGALRGRVCAPHDWRCRCVPRPGGAPFAEDDQLVVPYSTAVFEHAARAGHEAQET